MFTQVFVVSTKEACRSIQTRMPREEGFISVYVHLYPCMCEMLFKQDWEWLYFRCPVWAGLCWSFWTLCACVMIHVSFSVLLCIYAGVRLASADWGTWILHTECVNSGWTPGCTVSGTLWQPRPTDPARDCTVHREVLYSCSHLLLSLPSLFLCALLHFSTLPLLSTFFNLSLHTAFLFVTTPPAFHSPSISLTLCSSQTVPANGNR